MIFLQVFCQFSIAFRILPQVHGGRMERQRDRVFTVLTVNDASQRASSNEISPCLTKCSAYNDINLVFFFSDAESLPQAGSHNVG